MLQPSLTECLHYWWRVEKLASRQPIRWSSMHHYFADAQEVQAHIRHRDEQQSEALHSTQQCLAAANLAVEVV